MIMVYKYLHYYKISDKKLFNFPDRATARSHIWELHMGTTHIKCVFIITRTIKEKSGKLTNADRFFFLIATIF